MVVAIDGPSGVGKTTVARAVADALGLPYLDTGAYYRLATLVALRAGADPDSDAAVLAALDGVDVDFADGRLLLDGGDVYEELRSERVTDHVSAVAAHRSVRDHIVDLQRRWVEEHGGSAVVEGRDIGTVVFPEADVKVFLTADAATRAKRRAGQPEAAGRELSEIVARLEARDAADSTREASPLRAADDATIVDTTDLGVAEVVAEVLALVGTVDSQ